MTTREFKQEVIDDLNYQLEKKGRPFTSEHWYLSKIYDLSLPRKKKAINELIAKGRLIRLPSTAFLPEQPEFPVLSLFY